MKVEAGHMDLEKDWSHTWDFSQSQDGIFRHLKQLHLRGFRSMA